MGKGKETNVVREPVCVLVTVLLGVMVSVGVSVFVGVLVDVSLAVPSVVGVLDVSAEFVCDAEAGGVPAGVPNAVTEDEAVRVAVAGAEPVAALVLDAVVALVDDCDNVAGGGQSAFISEATWACERLAAYTRTLLNPPEKKAG
jgi:hypothetical protein